MKNSPSVLTRTFGSWGAALSSTPVLESPLGLVPPGWRLVRLKEITTKIGSGATPRGGSAVYRESGTAFVRSQNVYDRSFSLEGLARISDEHAQELDGVALQRGDVLLNITGDGVTFGRSCLVPDDLGAARVNQHVAIVRANRSVCHPGYLLSFLTHPLTKQYIESFNAGGSRRAITKGHIESFIVPLPPLNEQEEIAEILGSLDDKINLNRRVNQTLEAMAQTLFRSWFVDFDPVHAKAEGRRPEGLDAATAALFPSKLVDSKLGTLPAGWLLKKVSDTVEGVFDGPHATPPEATCGPIFLGIKNLTGTAIDLADARCISEADWPTWTRRVEPKPGDIVFTYEATLGHFALIPQGLRCCLGRRTALVRPQSNHYFLFHWFIGKTFQGFLKTHTHPGATVDRILLTDFPSYPVLAAPQPLIDRFEALAAPVWSKIHANQSQNQSLAILRDALLPELLSGAIRVGEVEAKLAASV